MFIRRRVWERLMEKLDLDNEAFLNPKAFNLFSLDNTMKDYDERLLILELKMKTLLAFLKLKYQTDCSEELPRIIKQKKGAL